MNRFPLLLLALPALLPAEIVPGRYIVELSEQPVASVVSRARLHSSEARAQRDRVGRQQLQLRNEIRALRGAVLHTTDTVLNSITVEISDAEATLLGQLPGVVRVYPVREFRPHLDHALTLHRAPEAWNQVGIDNAGRGIKIGIIDSGIDVDHPGFQDPSLPIPEGYPKVNVDSDRAYTNSKVIVARSYADSFRRTDPDPSARDRVGHGSSTAFAAAGVPHSGPMASISGLAPKAWLGSYKVFGSPGVNDAAPTDLILKAIDDAVADGMDVLNLSLGTDVASSIDGDPEVHALERAVSLGVIVVVSAGNNGPDPATINSPATAPSVIAVGASVNGRVFAAGATVAGLAYAATPSSGRLPSSPVTGRLVEAGLACAAPLAGSLTGAIAFILRGDCTFEEKLNNAQSAGAIGALVYTDQDRPEPITMSVGSATLPASMVSYENGIEIKERLPGPLEATLDFVVTARTVSPERLAGFSSKGPSLENAIKPEIIATGTSLYTASRNGLHGPGYTLTQGTSFSSPLVAGAAAVVKAARPGLTEGQYRSLLIHTAARGYQRPGVEAGAQQAGAGVLDLGAAVRSTAAIAPATLSFGSGGPDGAFVRSIMLTNVGTASEIFLLSAVGRNGAPSPQFRESSVRLAPGQSVNLPLAFAVAGLLPGGYDGFLVVQGTTSGVESHVPYWYAVPSPARYITVLSKKESLKPGTTSTDALLIQITDAAGLPVEGVTPVVTVVSGGGEVVSVRSRSRLRPALHSISVRLGDTPGSNVFRVEAGEVRKDVTLTTN